MSRSLLHYNLLIGSLPCSGEPLIQVHGDGDRSIRFGNRYQVTVTVTVTPTVTATETVTEFPCRNGSREAGERLRKNYSAISAWRSTVAAQCPPVLGQDGNRATLQVAPVRWTQNATNDVAVHWNALLIVNDH
jgi:hypothetical protein